LKLHPGTDPKVEPCLIYDTEVVLDWIKMGTPIKTVANYALDFVSEKARELGFEEEWKDLWGRRRGNFDVATAAGLSSD